jgi:hypothetical protein
MARSTPIGRWWNRCAHPMVHVRGRCHLGELNGSDQLRWLRTVEVYNEQGDAQQLKLFPSHVEPPPDDPQVARVLVHQVRLERTRRFGACYLALELWRRLELDRSSSRRWTTILPMCPGRVWRRYWRSTGCARQAANCPSNSVGIPLRHELKKTDRPGVPVQLKDEGRPKGDERSRR